MIVKNSDPRPIIDDEAATVALVREKLTDALTPGYQVEFDPEEAELAGAFPEDALSEQDAVDSGMDLVDASVPVVAPRSIGRPKTI